MLSSLRDNCDTANAKLFFLNPFVFRFYRLVVQTGRSTCATTLMSQIVCKWAPPLSPDQLVKSQIIFVGDGMPFRHRRLCIRRWNGSEPLRSWNTLTWDLI